MPGVKIASMYCAAYLASELTGSGPISATRAPPRGRHPATSIVSSQTFPSDSRTVPRWPLAASASASAEYVSRCQNTGARGSSANIACAVIQQPTSPVRSLTGLQIYALTSEFAQSVMARHSAKDENGFMGGSNCGGRQGHSTERSACPEYADVNSLL